MANRGITFVGGTVADNLLRFLIQEEAVLIEVARKVEWIQKELRQMQAYLEHIGRSRQGFDEPVEELNQVARDAEDVIQDFVLKSVKRRRRGVLYLFDRYKVGKELEDIIRRMRNITRRVRNISKRTKNRHQDQDNYEQANRGMSVIIENPGGTSAASASTPNTRIAQAVEKLSNLLSQGLITGSELREIVEQARDELVGTQNIVSSLKSTSQRENVWLEEVDSVCDLTEQIAEDFITARKNMKEHALFLPFRRLVCERKFRRQMECVSTQIGDALHRRLTYGLGEVDLDSEDEISAEPETIQGEQKATKKNKLPMLNTVWSRLSSYFVIFKTNVVRSAESVFDPLSLLAGSVHDDIIRQVSLWRSVDRNLKSTQRDLALMRALFNDIESAQGLTETQKVWVKQLRLVAQNAQSLIDAGYRKGSFFSKLRFANAINGLLYDIRTILDRKKIYGIANMEGRNGSAVPLGPSIQVQKCESETISIVERDDDSSTEQQQSHAPAASSYRQVTGLQRKVQSIKGEKQMMDALFQDAQEMGELDRRSEAWVEEMKGIAREAESVINDYAEKWEHKQVYIHILKFRSRLVIERKLDKIRTKIQDASARRNRYDLAQIQIRAQSSSVVLRLSRRTQPSLTVRESSILGFDDDAEFLTAQLLSFKEPRHIIAIVGIRGTGKTELARFIFNSNAVKGAFEYRAQVQVPPKCTAKMLLEYVAKKLMGDQKDGGTTQDPFQALKTFLGNKRCLIALDGIETYKVLDPLKKIILDGSTVCRLLLTSRNTNLDLLASGTRIFVYPLQLLDDENSWLLFRRNLKKSIPAEPELMKVGNQIVTKCAGLPSEILKMSGLLSQKDVTKEEWSKVLQELNQDPNPWLETLNTINLNLPLYLRRCLFYFVLFPAEFGIPARRLVVLWVAEGLVHYGENGEPPEQVAESYLTELIDLNMVQIAKRKRDGKVKTCRLPNALRELWLTEANESRFLPGQNETDSDSVPKNSIIRRVADHIDDKACYNHIHGTARSPSTLLRDYYKNVLSFLSFDAREGNKPGQEIGNFLNRCISINCLLLLRVLDLERVYKPRLPKSIGRLSRLRYLGLRWTYLESLPSSVSSLLKLQTLDLKHTYINILTSSIWKMELRHLFLSESYRSRFPPQPAGNYLSDLRTLWGLFVDEETPVKGGLDRLVNITKLGLACQSMSSQPEAMISQLDAVADWIENLKCLKSLRLKSRGEDCRPRNLHLKSLENHKELTDMYLLGGLSILSTQFKFPPNLTELTLSHSKLQDDDMQILKDLPNLQSLCLLAESYMGKSLECNCGSFPQLHVLKLWRLEQLEKWTIEQKALPRLRQLEIRSCDSLKMLPDGLKDISTLLELKLTDMPMELESRVSNTDGEDRHKISHIPNVWVNDTGLSFASQSSDTSDILPRCEGISTGLQNQKGSDASTSTILQCEIELETSCAWK